MAKKEINQENTTQEGINLRVNKLKMSRPELSEFIGVPVRTIEDYESGRRTMTQSYIERLRAAHSRDLEVTRRIVKEISEEIERRYPNGIMSEVKE